MDLETFIKGHHLYKDIWKPKQGEQLDILMEADNQMDKCKVCVKINEKIVGHLKKGTSGRFAKTIFYCAVMRTQALGQKLLVKGVILAMERKFKSLVN